MGFAGLTFPIVPLLLLLLLVLEVGHHGSKAVELCLPLECGVTYSGRNLQYPTPQEVE